jgi:hypothetical protein
VHERLGRGPHAFGPTHSIFSRVAHLVAEVGVHGGLHERKVDDADVTDVSGRAECHL